MTQLRIDLESGRRHYLILSGSTADPWRLSLHHSASQRRSALHEAFRRHLRVRFDDREATVVPEADLLESIGPWQRLVVSLGREQSIQLGTWRLTGGTISEDSLRYVLSPIESRFLSDNGAPLPVPWRTRADPGLTTDLHVHFAGCIAARELVKIGIESGVHYPIAYLGEAGIHPGGTGDVLLSELPEAFLPTLESRLSIPLDEQVTFVDMERIYRLRSPITKNREAFLPLCRRIASDYAAMGIRYAELSLSNVIEADRLRAIHREMPDIEQATGVALRFLAAFHRYDDYEWDLDYIDRIEALYQSRYIVGADFMGHETNSTRDFAKQLGELARRLGALRPGFVVRVHAGENPAHPENVPVAVEAVEGTGVQLRIGHGLYGVDDATIDRLNASGAIVEFNLNSNFALNNIQGSASVPIIRYIDRGVAVVLGTDGYGIYQSTMPLEARAAMLCGVDEAGFARIRATEDNYLARRERSDAALPSAPVFVVPEDQPAVWYTPAVVSCKAEAIARYDEQLRARLAEISVPLLDRTELTALFRGRQCISFAGAWRKSWDAVSPAQQQVVRQEVDALLAGLSAEKTVLLTGGTRDGVDGVVQAAARSRGFVLLGAIVNATPPQSLDAGGITHAYLVGSSLYDKAAGLYNLLKEYNGLCLFIGGGSIVNDEIQTAANLRLRYALMDGPEGASTEQARQQPERAFRTAADLLRLMSTTGAGWASTDDPYWHLGANPTVDVVATRIDPAAGRRQVLLIQRDVNAPSEGGKWALPGGFQMTSAPRGTPWVGDVESARNACLRELLEESGLDVRHLADHLLAVGVYEGGGRDPRDTPRAWSRSEAFALHLPDSMAGAPLCGADDACDARWFDTINLPADLAFDHQRIVADGLHALCNAS